MKIEHYPYYPGLDASDLLDLRMACSEMASLWHNRANAKDEKDPETCRRIGNRYSELWEKFYDVQAASESKPLWKELHPNAA